MGRDGWMGFGLLVLSGWLYRSAAAIPPNPLVPIGPGFYPRILLLLAIFLSLALMVQDLLAARKPRKKETKDFRGWLQRYRPTLLSFVLFSLYVLLLPRLGYLLSTTLFVTILQWLLGHSLLRRLPGSLLIGIGTSVVTHLVFEKYLYVLLPRGTWIP